MLEIVLIQILNSKPRFVQELKPAPILYAYTVPEQWHDQLPVTNPEICLAICSVWSLVKGRFFTNLQNFWYGGKLGQFDNGSSKKARLIPKTSKKWTLCGPTCDARVQPGTNFGISTLPGLHWPPGWRLMAEANAFWAAAPKGSMTYAFTHMGDFFLLLLLLHTP